LFIINLFYSYDSRYEIGNIFVRYVESKVGSSVNRFPRRIGARNVTGVHAIITVSWHAPWVHWLPGDHEVPIVVYVIRVLFAIIQSWCIFHFWKKKTIFFPFETIFYSKQIVRVLNSSSVIWNNIIKRFKKLKTQTICFV